MISKELLSKVLGIQILRVIPTKENVIWYTFKDCYEGKDFINIHELAHKCKEWAYDRLIKTPYMTKKQNVVIRVSRSGSVYISSVVSVYNGTLFEYLMQTQNQKQYSKLVNGY